MECSICKKPTNKRCSRCRAKYYCSPSCQKKDYTDHVLVCPPTSADILVKNVFDDLIPKKIAVQYEYGFCNCMSPNDQSCLLGLYIGLVKFGGCSASQLHSWWKNGELPLNIKKAYAEGNIGEVYYQWFLKNEHVLKDLRKYEGEKSDRSMADKYHTIVKPYLSEHDQTVPIESLPESKREVINFYTVMLLGSIPRIEDPFWIKFGFCTCKFGKDNFGEENEVRLGGLYRELIIQKGCNVDEFHDAYLSGSVLDLLKRKCSDNNWLSVNRIEVSGYRQPTKSAYCLKQYVLSESVGLIPPVNVDYGFVNCHTEDERKQLKLIYRKLVKAPQFDPQDLHKACMAGNTYNYVSSILPNEVLKAELFRNMYPLKDFS